MTAEKDEVSVDIIPTLEGATITWDVDTDSNQAIQVDSGSSVSVPLQIGENIITIHVEKAGSTAKDYVITVTRSNS